MEKPVIPPELVKANQMRAAAWSHMTGIAATHEDARDLAVDSISDALHFLESLGHDPREEALKALENYFCEAVEPDDLAIDFAKSWVESMGMSVDTGANAQ